jgi:hypothetical protein
LLGMYPLYGAVLTSNTNLLGDTAVGTTIIHNRTTNSATLADTTNLRGSSLLVSDMTTRQETA